MTNKHTEVDEWVDEFKANLDDEQINEFDRLIDHIATTLTDEMVERLEREKKEEKTWKKKGRGSTSPVNVHYNQALTKAQTIIKDKK